MQASNLPQLIGVPLILIFICGLALFAGYDYLETSEVWADEGPGVYAAAQLRACLQAEGDEHLAACDQITTFPCWNALHGHLHTRNNPYTVDVMWVNWEGRMASRGGDEVHLKVQFADGHAYEVQWYEGKLEYCTPFTG